MNRDEVFREIARRGGVRAEVTFSGGNDEGYVENIVIVGPEGKLQEFQEYYWKDNEKPQDYNKAFVDALVEPVYDKWGSFAGEFSVYGKVVWNITDRKVNFKEEVSHTNYDYEESEW